MSQERPSSSSVPPFKSQLPDSLLAGLSDKDLFLYKSIDEMKQGQDWLVTQAVEHDRKLEEVRVQATKTNGRLLGAEDKIKAAEPAIHTVQTVVKIVQSRWFWIASVAFLVIVLPWIVTHAPPPVQVIKWAIGLG